MAPTRQRSRRVIVTVPGQPRPATGNVSAEVAAQPTALYRFFRDTELLYIGIAADPEARFRRHAKKSAWWPLANQRMIEWYPDRATADGAETVAVAVERPRCNDRKVIRGTPEKSGDFPLISFAYAGEAAPAHVAVPLGIKPGELVLKLSILQGLDDVPLILMQRWTRVVSPPVYNLVKWLGHREIEATREPAAAERELLRLMPEDQVEYSARVSLTQEGEAVSFYEDMQPAWFAETGAWPLWRRHGVSVPSLSPGQRAFRSQRWDPDSYWSRGSRPAEWWRHVAVHGRPPVTKPAQHVTIPA